MNAKAELEQQPRLDVLKWLVVIAMVGGGVFANHYYASNVSVVIRFVVLVLMAAAAIFIALQSSQGQAFWAMAKESRIEIRKVVWPTRQEALHTTLAVFGVVVVSALILWGIDSALGWAVSKIIS